MKSFVSIPLTIFLLASLNTNLAFGCQPSSVVTSKAVEDNSGSEFDNEYLDYSENAPDQDHEEVFHSALDTKSNENYCDGSVIFGKSIMQENQSPFA